jgi:NAD-specific glutamate dehydrogenase
MTRIRINGGGNRRAGDRRRRQSRRHPGRRASNLPLKGGRINTDFIDNSAGVDCSDNEVNIKIALGAKSPPRPAGASRSRCLAGIEMTDDVAGLVLLPTTILQDTGVEPIAERGGAAALPALELRAHMADLIRNAVADRSLADCVADLSPGIALLDRQSERLIRTAGREAADAFQRRLEDQGTPSDLARAIVHLSEVDGAVGIVSLATRSGTDPAALTSAFGALGQATGLDWAQGAAMALSPTDPWERLLVAGLARDFQQMRLDTIARLGGEPEGAVNGWMARNEARVRQFRTFVDRAKLSPQPSPAMLAQLAGQARTLLARA